jgi:hypothetical protein
MKLYDSQIKLNPKDLILFKDCQANYKFHNNQDREISLCMKNDSFIFKVKDVVSFECFTKTDEIFYKFYKYGTEKLLEYWFTHTLLPIFFTLTNKYYFLHAGAVKVEENSVLFMADSMGGKSTMTDYFLQKGHTLISDDKVGTFEKDGKMMIVPSYPYHRPYRKFEDLGYKVENFAEASSSLDAIYILDVDASYRSVELKEIKGIEKVGLLIRGTDIGLAVFQKERFTHISKLANVTPVFSVHIPKDLERLSEAYEQIVKKTQQLGEKNEFEL